MCDRLKGLPGLLIRHRPRRRRRRPRHRPRVRDLGAGTRTPRLAGRSGRSRRLGGPRRWLARTWHRLDALFIGGSTEWKGGPHATALAREAKQDGLWVHWGRVDTRRRVDLISATGAADSFDGSKWARWRKTYLDEGLRWLQDAAVLNELAGIDVNAARHRREGLHARRLESQHACEAQLRADNNVIALRPTRLKGCRSRPNRCCLRPAAATAPFGVSGKGPRWTLVAPPRDNALR